MADNSKVLTEISLRGDAVSSALQAVPAAWQHLVLSALKEVVSAVSGRRDAVFHLLGTGVDGGTLKMEWKLSGVGENDPLRDTVAAIIGRLEESTDTVCMKCGAPGTLQCVAGAWLTSCPNHTNLFGEDAPAPAPHEAVAATRLLLQRRHPRLVLQQTPVVVPEGWKEVADCALHLFNELFTDADLLVPRISSIGISEDGALRIDPCLNCLDAATSEAVMRICRDAGLKSTRTCMVCGDPAVLRSSLSTLCRVHGSRGVLLAFDAHDSRDQPHATLYSASRHLTDWSTRHPRLFQDGLLGIHFSVPAGWANLVAAMLEAIDALLDDEEARALRIAYLGRTGAALSVRWEYRQSPPPRMPVNEISGILGHAQRESMLTCEVCGAPGWMQDIGGWSTLCTLHAASRAGHPFDGRSAWRSMTPAHRVAEWNALAADDSLARKRSNAARLERLCALFPRLSFPQDPDRLGHPAGWDSEVEALLSDIDRVMPSGGPISFALHATDCRNRRLGVDYLLTFAHPEYVALAELKARVTEKVNCTFRKTSRLCAYCGSPTCGVLNYWLGMPCCRKCTFHV